MKDKPEGKASDYEKNILDSKTKYDNANREI